MRAKALIIGVGKTGSVVVLATMKVPGWESTRALVDCRRSSRLRSRGRSAADRPAASRDADDQLRAASSTYVAENSYWKEYPSPSSCRRTMPRRTVSPGLMVGPSLWVEQLRGRIFRHS